MLKMLEVYYKGKLVGTLAETPDKLIAFQYSEQWLKSGFSISPLSLPLKDRVIIGRDAKSCNLIIHEVPYISRKHCAVEVQNGNVYIMDLGSSYGTFLQTGEKIPPNRWIRAEDAFFLVNRENTFRISEKYLWQNPD